jgi:preprotein translocase SecE subunit
VARDRQRAKQRKARRAQNPGPARSQPYRADLPGELEHSSGEVDEFDAALVAGAGGQPIDAFDDEDDPDAAGRGLDVVEEEDPDAAGQGLEVVAGEDRDAAGQAMEVVEEDPDAARHGLEVVEEDADVDAELEQAAVAAAPAERRDVVAAGTPGAPTRRGAGRFIGFLRASWAELQRVQWPDRRQVTQATAVVIGFVVVAGLYLGVADWVAKKIVDYII